VSSTVYASTYGGGVYKSTDAGTSWRLGNNGLGGTYHYALIIDPEVPAILYSGTELGVFKSTDGGSNWSAANSGLTTIAVLALAIDRETPASVYAGTIPTRGDWNKDIGVFKTSDGGGHWSPVNHGLFATGVGTLAVDPQSPMTLYAGTGRGIFKSTDGGGSWSDVNTGLNTPFWASSLAIDAQTGTTLYAGTDLGVFQSADGGASWAAVNNGLTNLLVLALTIDPQVPATLYAGTARGVFKSTDRAASWSPLDMGLGDRTRVSSLSIDPQIPTTLYASAYDTGTLRGGTLKSIDGGTSWSVVNSSFLIVAVDPQTSTTLYGGNDQGVFKSTDGGASWIGINAGLTNPHIMALVINPRNPSMIFAGTSTGGVFTSTDAGASWSPMNDGLTNPILYALAIDPQTATRLYAGTGAGVFGITLARPHYAMTVGTTGLGRGTVTSSPSGIDCGADCSESYLMGTTVTLTARPALGSIFTGWRGCDAVAGARCTVTMGGERAVSASFLGLPLTITIRSRFAP
jgi:photosystem II stability/assembly factor-like uncharacterized protein